eukprot:2043108-Amphidinium_carterae.1
MSRADGERPCLSWFARVPSKSNPADAPSRGDDCWCSGDGFCAVEVGQGLGAGHPVVRSEFPHLEETQTLDEEALVQTVPYMHVLVRIPRRYWT